MSEYHGGPNPPQQPFQPQYQQPKKKHTLRNVLIGAGVGFVVLVGGCTAIVGSALDGTDPAKQTSGAAPAAVESSSPVPTQTTPPAVEEPAPTPTPTDSGIAKVGAKEWFTYTDGIQVQVTKVARFKISQYAAGGKPGDVGVLVTVTIKNGSGSAFDTAAASVNLTAGPNGDEADSVFDSENGADSFNGSIANGRSKTAKFGFAVSKAHLKQLVVEVSPSWDHDSSFFEGSVK